MAKLKIFYIEIDADEQTVASALRTAMDAINFEPIEQTETFEIQAPAAAPEVELKPPADPDESPSPRRQRKLPPASPPGEKPRKGWSDARKARFLATLRAKGLNVKADEPKPQPDEAAPAPIVRTAGKPRNPFL